MVILASNGFRFQLQGAVVCEGTGAHGIGDGFLATQTIVSKAHIRRGVGVVDAEQLAGIGVIAVAGDKGIAGGIRAGPGAGGLCKKKI